MLDTLSTLFLANVVTDIQQTFQVQWPTFIAQIVNFLIVAAILYKFAFKRVLVVIDERQRKIADGLQYAEEMKNKLADAEKKYNEQMKKAQQEANQVIEEARDRAKVLMEKQTQDAIARSEELIAAAKRSAEQEKHKMLQEVRAEVTDLVVATTAKVLRKELSDDDRKKYTESSAQQLHANN